MGMKALEDLRDILCREVDEIAEKGELSAGDLDTVHKLTDTIKNIDKIEMLEDGGDYSQMDGDYSRTYSRDGGWTASGTYGHGGHAYDRGSSYAQRRDMRGRYSRADGREMAEQLRQMMNDGSLNNQQREAIRKAVEQLEK